MKGLIKWNLSSKGRAMRNADGFFVSFPKSGRTWIRVFYYSYLSFIEQREFTWDPKNFPNHPHIFFTHDRWEHKLIPGLSSFIRGKHLIPPDLRKTHKIALLLRDPRDVAVSLFFDLEKRATTRSTNYGWHPMPLPEMLRHPKFGLPQIVDVMNQWIDEWDGLPNFLLLRYEECRSDESTNLSNLLEFFGLASPDPIALSLALDYSKFDAMKQREQAGDAIVKELRLGNRADPDSFKSRRGKVGGFVDYFSDEDHAYAAELMNRLDTRLGYYP